MDFMPILVHVVMFITATLAIAILYGRIRASERARSGELVDVQLLDPWFSLLALIFFGLPAIGCGLFLRGGGFEVSGMLTAAAATVVGLYLGSRRAKIVR